eukprot:jgi/Hompol1/7075/HPOL_005181-RA
MNPYSLDDGPSSAGASSHPLHDRLLGHQSGLLDDEDADWPDADSDPASARNSSAALPAPDNFYGILNVSSQATEDEIKNSYKRLCFTFHPDKFTDKDEKIAAQKRFQAVQRAYEVLIDVNKRHIYDLYGETAIDQAWELGPKLKSQDEIREEYERRIRMKKQMDALDLVKSRGEISLELDASRYFQRRSAAKALGLSTLGIENQETRFTDYIVLPGIRRAHVSHSWETRISDKTRFILSGSVLAQKNGSGGNVMTTVRHVVSPSVTCEATAIVANHPAGQIKIVKEFPSDMFVAVVAASDTIFCPPNLKLSVGRKITENTTGFLSYRPGLFRIGSWGPADDRNLGISSCSIGFNHNKDRREWNFEIEAGLANSHISLSHARPLPGHIRGRIDLTASLASGTRINVSGDRRLDRYTHVGMGVGYGTSGNVSLRLRVSRLGQKFSLPIFLSSEPDVVLAVLAFTLPLCLGVAIDQLVLEPWRQRRIMASIERVRQENTEILAEQRTDAMQAIELMRESVARRVETEETRQGLVIIQALYGKLPPSEHASVRALSPQGIKDAATAIRKRIESVLSPGSKPTTADPTSNTSSLSVEYIDVTIPVQALVNNGQLHISGGHTKASIIGFWDPCYGEKKRLRITYQFQGRIHQVEVDDRAPVAAPLRGKMS